MPAITAPDYNPLSSSCPRTVCRQPQDTNAQPDLRTARDHPSSAMPTWLTQERLDGSAAGWRRSQRQLQRLPVCIPTRTAALELGFAPIALSPLAASSSRRGRRTACAWLRFAWTSERSSTLRRSARLADGAPSRAVNHLGAPDGNAVGRSRRTSPTAVPASA